MNHRTPALLLAATLTAIPTPTPASSIMREFYRVQSEALRLTTEEQHRADDLEDLLEKQARDDEFRHLQHMQQLQNLEYQLRSQQ